MSQRNNKITLSEFLRHVEQNLIIADAEMQVLQNTAWNQFKKEYKSYTNHYNLTEGIQRLNNLMISEMAVKFWVRPVKYGILSRLWNWLRSIFGKPTPIACCPQISLLGHQEVKQGTSFEVNITFRRNEQKHYRGKIEQTETDGEQIFLEDFYGVCEEGVNR